jgi:hypothetical protein
MTEDAAGSRSALLPVDNADATAEASQVSHGACSFEVVVGCAECGVRQAFRGRCRRLATRRRRGRRGISVGPRR